jgi:methylenetetrahydrofolate reductase (NADPH)
MRSSPLLPPDAEAGARELVAGASIEIAARELHEAGDSVRAAASGRQVFIPWTPNLDARAMMAATSRASELGLAPVPHVVARRLASEQAARELLGELGRRGAEAVLLVGGDLREPAGPYRSSFELLASGLLQRCGLAQAGVCGYPEGHPQIGPAILAEDLDRKLGYARANGVRLFVVSQFCFDADAVARWAAGLRARGVDAPLRVGVAGPTTVARLLRLAVQCGIGHSMRALRGRVGSLTRLASTHDPAGLIREIAAARLAVPSLDPLSIHLFAFGGIAPTAQWLSRRPGDPAKLASV